MTDADKIKVIKDKLLALYEFPFATETREKLDKDGKPLLDKDNKPITETYKKISDDNVGRENYEYRCLELFCEAVNWDEDICNILTNQKNAQFCTDIIENVGFAKLALAARGKK